MLKQIILLLLLFQLAACNREPYIPDTNLVAGYVIGKEICHSDESQDYWLVDLTYWEHTPQYGDTIEVNGVTYTNVVKTKGLADTAKHIGTPVDIEFKTITPSKVVTSGCDVDIPTVYNLKEIFVINLGIIH